MAEALFTSPIFHKARVSLPWMLFQLAEQISASGGETLVMNVTGSNGGSLCVNIQRIIEDGDERLTIEVTDPAGWNEQGLVDTEDDAWKFDLGSIQSPVYLQNDDTKTNISQDLPVSDTMIREDVTDQDNELNFVYEVVPNQLSGVEEIEKEEPEVKPDDETHEQARDGASYIETENMENLLETGTAMMSNFNDDRSQMQISQLLQGDVNSRPQVLEITEGPDVTEITNILNEQGMKQESNGVQFNPAAEMIREGTQYTNMDMVEVTGRSDVMEGTEGDTTVPGVTLQQVVLPEGTQNITDMDQLASLMSQSMVDNLIVINQSESGDHDGTVILSDITQHEGAASETTWEVTGSENKHIDRVNAQDSQHSYKVVPSASDDSLKSKLAVNPNGKPVVEEPSNKKTMGDVAVEASIKVQNVKDIPRIVVDVEAFKCPACSKHFHSIDVLFGHFQRLHRDSKYIEGEVERVLVKDAYLCFLCRHPFHRFDAVRKHLETVHKVQMEKRKILREKVCPICNSKHSSLHTLRCHLNYKHQDHPKFKDALVAIHFQICAEQTPKRKKRVLLQCPFCLVNLTFKQFMHHLQLAHQDDPNYAEILSQSKAAMKKEKLRKLHETMKKCDTCDKTFPLTGYYSHMRSVHKTLNDYKFICEVCNKKFHSNWHLNMHLLIHKDERNHRCELCSSAFRNIYSLRKHKKTVHMKQYPYPCNKCDRGFHTKQMFRNHKCRPPRTGGDWNDSVNDADGRDADKLDVVQYVEVVFTDELEDGSTQIKTEEYTSDISSVENPDVPTDRTDNHEITQVPLDIPHGSHIQPRNSSESNNSKDTKSVVSESNNSKDTKSVVSAQSLLTQIVSETVTDKDKSVNSLPMTAFEALPSHNMLDLQNSLTSENPESRIKIVQIKMEDDISPVMEDSDAVLESSLVKSEELAPLSTQIMAMQEDYRYVDSLTGNQVCRICNKQFKNVMGICSHLRRVHHISKKPIKIFPCGLCGREFVLQSKLNTHMKVHQEISIPCDQCGRVLRSKYYLENHIRVVHDHQYAFNCDTCGRGFQKERLLIKHTCGRHGIDPESRTPNRLASAQPNRRLMIDDVNEPSMKRPYPGIQSEQACIAMLALGNTDSHTKSKELIRSKTATPDTATGGFVSTTTTKVQLDNTVKSGSPTNSTKVQQEDTVKKDSLVNSTKVHLKKTAESFPGSSQQVAGSCEMNIAVTDKAHVARIRTEPTDDSDKVVKTDSITMISSVSSAAVKGTQRRGNIKRVIEVDNSSLEPSAKRSRRDKLLLDNILSSSKSTSTSSGDVSVRRSARTNFNKAQSIVPKSLRNSDNLVVASKNNRTDMKSVRTSPRGATIEHSSRQSHT